MGCSKTQENCALREGRRKNPGETLKGNRFERAFLRGGRQMNGMEGNESREVKTSQGRGGDRRQLDCKGS